MKTIKLGVVMDPIANINPKKDSTFAMLLEAERRDWQIHYMQQTDLFLRDTKPYARMSRLEVKDTVADYYRLSETKIDKLTNLDLILMRVDPPFNMEYIYTTYILEQAAQENVLVVNHPQGLRDANEKLFTSWFPNCCPPTLVSGDKKLIREFVLEQHEIVLKPLDSMGGNSIFVFDKTSPNINVAIEILTNFGRRPLMAQRYIPEIVASGDKRILLIDGEPIEYALARIPAEGEIRGNLAAGGRGIAVPLSRRDREICAEVGDTLRRKGLIFVGLDVIGDYLTEINVTSPTCIRQLDEQCSLNISATLMDCLEGKLSLF